jgi:hypothetical protein
MSSDKYVGMDVHLATVVLAVLNAAGKCVMESVIEPPRECRRQFLLSQAAVADSSCWRSYNSSNSAGGILPIDSSSRRWLNQSTQARVAYSTSSSFRQGPRRWITSVLYNPMIDSLPKRRDRSRRSASKPCLTLSRHTAPQSSGDCHSYPRPFCLRPFSDRGNVDGEVASYGKHLSRHMPAG